MDLTPEQFALQVTSNLANFLEEWNSIPRMMDEAHEQLLEKIACVIEEAAELYYKNEPDPFDNRHPSRAQPDSVLGHVLKQVFRHQEFIDSLLSTYLQPNAIWNLQILAARILLNLIPGVDSHIFDSANLSNFIIWAERAPNPLRAYSLGVLAAAMDLEHIATQFKDQNLCLIPLMIERLGELCDIYFLSRGIPRKKDMSHTDSQAPGQNFEKAPRMYPVIHVGYKEGELFTAVTQNTSSDHQDNEDTDVDFLEYEPFQIYPLTVANEIRYILQYLNALALYQEYGPCVLVHAKKILDILVKFVDLGTHRSIELAFDSLRYLGTLMCHQKCAALFISEIGLQKILVGKVPRCTTAASCMSYVLYNLSGNEDIMQKVCILHPDIILGAVRYALWLLECKHYSSRSHSLQFFQYSLQYDVIRHAFDELDGFRKVLNTVTTLDIVVQSTTLPGLLSSEQVAASRQICRHAVLTLRNYYIAHIENRASLVRGSHVTYYNKPNVFKKTLEENIEAIVHHKPYTMSEPIEKIIKLDGIKFLLQLILMHTEWNYSGKMESIRCSLDILHVCTINDEVKLSLCDTIEYEPSMQPPVRKIGMSVILDCASPEKMVDGEVRKSALNVIVNCVAGPLVTEAQVNDSGTRLKHLHSNEEILTKVWNCVRATNGIMVLGSTLNKKSPIVHGDALRASACEALCGLARSPKVVQILSKRSFVSSDQLQVLMREPLLQDRRQEHNKFIKFCKKLMRMIASAPAAHPQHSSIIRAEIVSQTMIKYKDAQLFDLIAKHLEDKGLYQSAAALRTEANVDSVACTSTMLSSNSSSHLPVIALHCMPCLKKCPDRLAKSAAPQNTSVSDFPMSKDKMLTPKRDLKRNVGEVVLESIEENTQKKRKIIKLDNKLYTHTLPVASSSEVPQPSCLVIPSKDTTAIFPSKKCLSTKAKKAMFKDSSTTGSRSCALSNKSYLSYQQSSSNSAVSVSSCNKESFYVRHNIFPKTSCDVKEVKKPIDLDTIVTEYLRNQHANCKNPYVTCPPFDLLTPHQCPEPRYQNAVPSNISLRLIQKSITPSYWGRLGSRMNRTYMSTRYRDINTIPTEYGLTMTQCAFTTSDNLYVGFYNGDLKVINPFTAQELHSFACHQLEVTNIQTLKESSLFLTSGNWRRPETILWDANKNYGIVQTFDDECYAEFSKLTRDSIIATRYDRAQMYDIESGVCVATLSEPSLGNSYRSNRATFNYTDQLILSDGVIYDVRSHKPIHKLDKFNQRFNGVFHPNGLVIVSNAEIWDLRNYTLIRTINELEQCKLVFDKTGDVFYAAIMAFDSDHNQSNYRRYGTSVRAFNAIDYTCICTKDLQKSVNDIALNADDTLLSVIMCPSSDVDFGELDCKCHIYEVGRGYEAGDMDIASDEEEEGSNLQLSDDEDDDDDDDDDDQDDLDDQDDQQDEAELDRNDEDDDGLIEEELLPSGYDSRQSSDSFSASDDELYFAFRS